MSSTLSRVEGTDQTFARTGWRALCEDYVELTYAPAHIAMNATAAVRISSG